jgi:hypothetical protein
MRSILALSRLRRLAGASILDWDPGRILIELWECVSVVYRVGEQFCAGDPRAHGSTLLAIPSSTALILLLPTCQPRAHFRGARLQALQARTRPHFLFSLNAVLSLIGAKRAEVAWKIERLFASDGGQP